MSHLRKRKDAPDLLKYPIVSVNVAAIQEYLETGYTPFPYAMVSVQQGRVVLQSHTIHGADGEERTWIEPGDLLRLLEGNGDAVNTSPEHVDILAKLRQVEAENQQLKDRISRAQAALEGMVAIAL